MEVHALGRVAFTAFIPIMIVVDIVGHIRAPHEPTLKEAGWWSIIYTAMAILFEGTVWVAWGGEYGQKYFVGYATERTLSIDNFLVFVMMIAAFTVPRILQQEVLFFGIATALILRLIFTLLGATLIENFSWIFYIFGARFIWTALFQVREGTQEPSEHEAEDYKPGLFARTLAKVTPVSDGLYRVKLLYRHAGRTTITPLFPAIIAIGTVDVMFAVDSIPAIYSLIEEPYLALAANTLSLLGLRQLYFLIDDLLDRLILLHYGLAVILSFIDFKFVSHALHTNEVAVINDGHPIGLIPESSTGVSFAFIPMAFLITITASPTASARGDNTQSTPTARKVNIRSTPAAEDDSIPTTSLDPLATGTHHWCLSAPSHGQPSCSPSPSLLDWTSPDMCVTPIHYP